MTVRPLGDGVELVREIVENGPSSERVMERH
jgi:hypothetical protein